MSAAPESAQLQPVLQASGLRVQLGSRSRPVKAVDGLDLAIRRGETFALLGESGCGKSMTALALMRLLPESGRILDGSVKLQGKELLTLAERDMRAVRGGGIGMIFQEPMTSLNPVLTVYQQIAEAVRSHETTDGEALRARVLELLRAVHIPEPAQRMDEYPHQLSGGMKQRVMIACALAGRPQLLIADEPTTALDVTIQAQVLQLLRELQRETGMAILLITHDLGVVAETADRVAVMYAGQIVEQASTGEFFTNPRHPYSRKLFHSLPGAARRGRRLDVIHGMVPALDGELPPCRFQRRCPLADERCETHAPAWRSLAEEHFARCHHAEKALPDIPLAGMTTSDQTDGDPEHASHTAEPLLRTESLQVHFPIRRGLFKRVHGHVHAVDGVELEIGQAQTLGLVGESGCGKTTVGKGILQLIRPSGGRVHFNGLDLTALSAAELREHRRDIQIIFQDPFSSMNPRMPIGDIVAEGMLAQGLARGRADCEEPVRELLGQVGIREDAIHRYPHEFSGGQRQRICIARALAVKPRLIICDEPTSALDVSVQAQILNLLLDLQAQHGISYLFITHNISVVAYLAHQLAVMYLGRIVESGATTQVLDNPRHPYTQALLSAVPNPDPQAARSELIRLPGDLPSPVRPPPGCHFYPRCPQRMEQCRNQYPAIKALADGRRLSCHLATE